MQTIDLRGTKVAYVDTGAGQPVVLLHSSTGSKGQWQAALAAWADRYRVIAPDLLGYGDSDPWRGPRPLTLADEVECVGAVIARTDRPVHLVGHSYGGAVALHTAMEFGARIASLSLIEPTAFYLLPQAPDGEPPATAEIAEIAGVAQDVGESVLAGFPMAAAHRFIDYWCGQGAWARLPSERRWQISSRMGKVHQDFHALLCETTELAKLGEIAVPTLILCGTDSPRSTRRLSRVLTEAIPHARHRTIAGAGHMLPLTHAEAVNALIAEHVERASPRTPTQRPAVFPLPARRPAVVPEVPTAVQPSDDLRLAEA